ncbi:Salicylate hydroxylase [Gracilariopsis chorda]|uniref:Salicylate hydroxylase n=1 Tax=Gracilariopsis chorda TaxID=448386 RepID=A0A2V3J203_9FLOR|nr:Salicylate hydroxylase [Gracilariopsis chorda]|eukprot:PXF48399.1 Salicylate hydroxylase [Gracilariopsis chorda]
MLRGNAIDELLDVGLEEAAHDIIKASVPLSNFFFHDISGKLREVGDPSPSGTERLSRFAQRNDIVGALYKCFRNSAKTGSNQSAFYGRKELTAVEHNEDEVTALFADGSSWTGDLLVGCDGVRSVAAQYVAPERQFNFLGRRGWRGLASDDSFSTNGAYVIFGPEAGLFFNSYDVGVDQHGESWSHWAIFLKTDISGTPPGVNRPHGEIPKEILDRLPEDFVRLVVRTPASEIVHSSDYGVTPLPRYVRGRVALVGDAAHAMSSSLAWGMASGIADAVCLSNLITNGDCLLQSLEKYDNERRPITQKYQRTSAGVNRASLKR